MPGFGLNYKIRRTNGALNGNRGWLLTLYWLHSDHDMRSYPSTATLLEESGIRSAATLVKARRELIDMGALALVPHEHRNEREQALPPRQYVYKITGYLRLHDGTVIPTLYIHSPEELASHAESLQKIGVDPGPLAEAYPEIAQVVKVSVSEISVSEISVIETKVDTGKQVSIKNTMSPDGDGASEAGSKAQRKTRSTKKPRDPLFDTIALESFGIADTTQVGTAASRIGKAKKALLDIAPDLTPQALQRFYAYYRNRHPGVNPPRDAAKLCEHWLEFVEKGGKNARFNGAHVGYTTQTPSGAQIADLGGLKMIDYLDSNEEAES